MPHYEPGLTPPRCTHVAAAHGGGLPVYTRGFGLTRLRDPTHLPPAHARLPDYTHFAPPVVAVLCPLTAFYTFSSAPRPTLLCPQFYPTHAFASTDTLLLTTRWLPLPVAVVTPFTPSWLRCYALLIVPLRCLPYTYRDTTGLPDITVANACRPHIWLRVMTFAWFAFFIY